MTSALPGQPARLGPVSGHLENNGHTAAIVYPIGPDIVTDPLGWTQEHREGIRNGLDTVGAVLLTGLPVDLDLFSNIVEAVGGELLSYNERSTPRKEVQGNIYTSTEYPPDQSIPMHNESSYSNHWPEKLFFLCHTPAESGGATPIADSRAVLRELDPEVRKHFADGVAYTRTFRDGLGLSWQEAFQTESPDAVDAYCGEQGQEATWTDGGLKTRHRQPSWRTEPSTGEDVWFNQANLFHVSSLDDEVREALTAVYEDGDLPRNAYFGDGEPISDKDIAEINAVYAKVSLAMPWQAGSVLIINNMLMAHGREPFTGSRRVLVAMS
ncbi:TauD/TfdA family dioxygenase [Streptomyces sp. NBC_01104]|uniref:TauD/TfdA family dioxygenase n=1 Tax=Streptomyces sp. NBC_01104 TaxID=2903750 RepID=UPI00386F6539|nr:TauD/TfdA family dioxygenase [Streptomyces sp. NBC_01104]